MPPSIPAQDTRDRHIAVRGTPEDLAAVQAAAANLGLSGHTWARDKLLDALETQTGYRDTARRAAGRRPNHEPLKETPRLLMRVSAAEHEQITALAAGKGQTITELAWDVIAAALEQENRP